MRFALVFRSGFILGFGERIGDLSFMMFILVRHLEFSVDVFSAVVWMLVVVLDFTRVRFSLKFSRLHLVALVFHGELYIHLVDCIRLLE